MDAKFFFEFYKAYGWFFYIIIGAILMMLLLWYIVTARAYIKASFEMINRKRTGLRKIVDVGNDKRMISHSVDFRNGYYMDSQTDKDKLRVLTPDDNYYDEFGEAVTFYHQDGTMPSHFYRQQKFYYVDKNTNEIFKDKNGRYVTTLNLIAHIKDKYKATWNDAYSKVEDFANLGGFDNVVGKTVYMPLGLAIKPEGHDAIETADIINSFAEIEDIGFWKKILPYLIGAGIVIGVLVLINIIIAVQNYNVLGKVGENVGHMYGEFGNWTKNVINTGGFK